MLLLGAGMVAAPLVEHLGRLDNLTVKLTIGIIRSAFIPKQHLISNDLHAAKPLARASHSISHIRDCHRPLIRRHGRLSGRQGAGGPLRPRHTHASGRQQR